ncbi:MAG TPA: GldG family protein [Bryobacteraceae bacterium]|nr:GldG family protein [Bryobacteraceae bacterium]
MATKKTQRAANFAQAAVYTLIIVAILGVLNFLAQRYNKSFDATANKKYTLSDQTAKVVKNIQGDLTITYWDRPNGFPNAEDLFNRYKGLSPKVTVEYQDVDKKRTEAIAAGVKNPLPNIFIKVGNKTELAKSLTEEEVTGAMVRALKGGDRTVCFTSGYGEASVTDTTGGEGFGNVKDLTEKNNYKTKVVPLIPKAEIPLDCTILVVGGPKRNYLQPAVDAIKTYVENGGRALIMLEPPLKFKTEIDDNDGLVAVLDSWGVKMHKDLVLDLSGVGQLFGLGPELPIVTKYDDHAIVREMKDLPTGFPLVRSLEVAKGDKTTVSPLFSTTEDAVATEDLKNPQVNVKSAKPGARVLAAAGIYNTGKENGNGRFVVVGTSRWIGNGFLTFNGNRDLYMNMLNWLSSDEDLISIRPKDPEDRRLNMNPRQATMLFYGSVVVIPLAIIIAGVGVWWKRR